MLPPLMRRPPALAAASAVVLATAGARGADPPRRDVLADAPRPPSLLGTDLAREAPAEGFHPSLVLDRGRVPRTVGDGISVTIHGEYQLRYRVATDLRLEASPLRPELGKLGQNQLLYQWLRVTPRFAFKRALSVVGEADLPRGMIAGDLTKDVGAARYSFEKQDWAEFHPRALYLEWYSPVGLFRAGHQTSHWGSGIFVNDGDHASFFGDYVGGVILERLSWALSPMGDGTPLTLALAADLVFQDRLARLVERGDRAFQGVGAIAWRTPAAEIGLQLVVRHQARDAAALGEPALDEALSGVVDVAARFGVPVQGTGGFVYGEAEAVASFGRSSLRRGVAGPSGGAVRLAEEELAFGATATVGFAHARRVSSKDPKAPPRRWGDWAAELEWGFASGDPDPTDGVQRRFTFDPNHNVGLVLFDHVLAWKSARAATLGRELPAARLPPSGLEAAASNGGVFGAQYLNARVVVRPIHWLDLKGGVLVATATSDVVDPYQPASRRNFDGGDPRRRDLGLELDLGAEVRIAAGPYAVFQLGAEAGVLFPGHAFDDAAGAPLDTQAWGAGRVGVSY